MCLYHRERKRIYTENITLWLIRSKHQWSSKWLSIAIISCSSTFQTQGASLSAMMSPSLSLATVCWWPETQSISKVHVEHCFPPCHLLNCPRALKHQRKSHVALEVPISEAGVEQRLLSSAPIWPRSSQWEVLGIVPGGLLGPRETLMGPHIFLLSKWSLVSQVHWSRGPCQTKRMSWCGMVSILNKSQLHSTDHCSHPKWWPNLHGVS